MKIKKLLVFFGVFLLLLGLNRLPLKAETIGTESVETKTLAEETVAESTEDGQDVNQSQIGSDQVREDDLVPAGNQERGQELGAASEPSGSSDKSVDSDESPVAEEDDGAEPVVERHELMDRAPVVEAKQGWVQEADGAWYYYKPDGSLFYNQVITFGSEVAYYINGYGARETGLFADATGQVRYADEDGLLVLSPGWLEYGGQRYYATGDLGKLFADQFITFGSSVRYYMNKDASLAKGWIVYQNKRYYADENSGNLCGKGRWMGDYYITGEGETFQNQFISFGSLVKYYMDQDGKLTYGRFHYQGKLYHADQESGNLIGEARWLDDCYITSQGEVFANQFITFGSQVKYFMGPDGKLSRGRFSHQGKLYFADEETGNLIGRGRWLGDCYVTGQGEIFQNQFITFGPAVKYFMDSEGNKVRGKFSHAGKVYFADRETGNLIGPARWEGDCFVTGQGGTYQNRFITFGSAVAYYMGANGERQRGWVELDTGRYYLDEESCVMAKGFSTIKGKNYYFFPDGRLAIGKFYHLGREFYTDPQGVVSDSPWKHQDGKWYYLQANGEYYKERKPLLLDGKRYVFDKNGVWLEGYEFGIDISYHQQPSLIDYDRLSPYLDFGILRIGWSGSDTRRPYADSSFEKHYRELKARGIKLGVYYYSCATNPQEAVLEAKKTVELLAGRGLDLPVYFDLEDPTNQEPLDKDKLTAITKAYCDYIMSAGYRAGVYTSSYWYKHKVNDRELDKYERWMAHWSDKQPVYSRSYKIWQFSSQGRLPGYGSNLDFNYRFRFQ